MATAKELFEKFLDQEANSNYAYHLNDVADLRQERKEEADELQTLKMEFAVLQADLPQPHHESDLQDENQEILDKIDLVAEMDRVLAFVGDKTSGSLITKVGKTQEWHDQEPVFFTESDMEANLAFAFFNAHAIITAPQPWPFKPDIIKAG
jgi:DNA repair ATPase RecN